MPTEHTPGPWRPADRPMQGPTQRGWYPVQHVFNHEPFEGVLENEWAVYPPPGEAGPVCLVGGEANARLIAAAPELLDMCLLFARWAQAGQDFRYPPGSLQQLHAAIAKAQFLPSEQPHGKEGA